LLLRTGAPGEVVKNFTHSVAGLNIADPGRPDAAQELGSAGVENLVAASTLARMRWSAGAADASAVVVDDLDVVPVGVQDERAVVARVVDGALAGTAMVLVPAVSAAACERKAELYAQRHFDDVARGKSARDVRHPLRRLRDALRRRG
jgi:hypothetical protein